MTEVLVTGAAGFLGRHLVPALLETGHRVVALQHNAQLPPEMQARCERIVTGNIRDPAIQQEALRDVQVVCHLSAFVPGRMDDLSQSAPCYLTNAEATLELATAAAKGGIRRFIHLSAANMYATSNALCTESSAVFPSHYASAYFVSKLAAEIYLTQLGNSTGLEVVILRAGSLYGPGELSRRAIPTFLRNAAAGQPLEIANGGAANFNFVYVADVVDCIVQAMGTGARGIYNVAPGVRTSPLDVAKAIVELFHPREVSLHIEPAKPGSFAGFPAVSIEKARATWNFNPRTLAAGIADYRANLAKAAGQP
jgi:UDP-glucose 4-epimerase